MDRCQICNRAPAKWVSFKAHVGFLVFRGEYAYAGRFCRDHAMEAYQAARLKTAKGMWFSPGAILFGSVRSAWDSAKLLELPGEVLDEPWVPHVAKCPDCSHKNWTPAGPIDCQKCGKPFVVVSCEHCCTVHIEKTGNPFKSAIPSCRKCQRSTSGHNAVRNWPLLISGIAIAEAAAAVAAADGIVSTEEKSAFCHITTKVLGLDNDVSSWLLEKFEASTAVSDFQHLDVAVKNCDPEFIRLILLCASLIANADGPPTTAEEIAFAEIARRCGVGPETASGAGAARNKKGEQDGRCWWVVLGVSREASLEEIDGAYRRLAMQFHPDRWQHVGTIEQQMHAAARMKEINAAHKAAQSERSAQRNGDGDRDAPYQKAGGRQNARQSSQPDTPPRQPSGGRPTQREYAKAAESLEAVAKESADLRKEWDQTNNLRPSDSRRQDPKPTTEKASPAYAVTTAKSEPPPDGQARGRESALIAIVAIVGLCAYCFAYYRTVHESQPSVVAGPINTKSSVDAEPLNTGPKANSVPSAPTQDNSPRIATLPEIKSNNFPSAAAVSPLDRHAHGKNSNPNSNLQVGPQPPQPAMPQVDDKPRVHNPPTPPSVYNKGRRHETLRLPIPPAEPKVFKGYHAHPEFNLGLEMFRKNYFTEAAKHFQAAHDNDPDEAIYLYFLALALRKSGEIQSADRNLALAVEADLKRPIAKQTWGQLFLRIQGNDRVWLENGGRSVKRRPSL